MLDWQSAPPRIFCGVLENLKLAPAYDGLLYLAESARRPPMMQSHRHNELELNLVVEGEISYVINGHRSTFRQRTLLWLFPSQEHQLVDRAPRSRNYVAVFKPQLVRRAARSLPYAGLMREPNSAGGVLQCLLEPETFDLVRRTMDAMLVGAPDPDVLNRELGFGPGSAFRYEHQDPAGLNAGLMHLLLLCWRSQQTGKALGEPVQLHPAVRQALARLSEPNEDNDLTSLARRCGTSATHLSRMFAAQVGVSISRYRNRARLARFFQNYHGEERTTLTEAVYAAGFGSYAQFHRVFTEAYGCGPRASLRPAGTNLSANAELRI